MKLELQDFPPEVIAAIADAVASRLAPLLPSEVMNTKQAAAYLGMSTQRLEIWRCQGGGPKFVKRGRAVRYRRADLDEFLQAGLRRHT